MTAIPSWMCAACGGEKWVGSPHRCSTGPAYDDPDVEEAHEAAAYAAHVRQHEKAGLSGGVGCPWCPE